jgi:hypothetical protein
MGIVGMNGLGRTHIARFHKMKGARVVALCDVDKRVLAREAKKFEARKEKVTAYVDIRRMLDDKNVDAICVVTPNHWHSLMTIWACQAGKDVKVEKPVSHNIWEGRQMVLAAEKYNRIVQAGTESRSDPALKEAFEYIQAGNLGKILCARGFCYKRRTSIGKVTKPTKVPDYIDYNLWTGPAPLVPLMRKSLHYNWHWVWATGNGDIGNQGAHEMDMCRWALGEDRPPRRVISIGGRFGYDDDAETANTQLAFFDYEKAPLIFEVRGLPMKSGMNAMDHYRGARVGIVIECENGYFSGGVGGGVVYDNSGNKIKQFKSGGGRGHSANFLKAVRSRKSSDLNAHIPKGHVSASLSHMANISHRLGQEASPDEIRESLKTTKFVTDRFEQLHKHLEANSVDPDRTRITLGAGLQFDPDTEKFTGTLANEANRLATRNYRKPFVVPENV